MAKTDYKTIDEYIAAQPKEVQDGLQSIRKTISEAIPQAKEVIGYQIPAFDHHGYVIFFSAFKSHYSIASPPPTMADFAEKLKGYKTSKSVFQVPYTESIPHELIAEMAQYKAAANENRKK